MDDHTLKQYYIRKQIQIVVEEYEFKQLKLEKLREIKHGHCFGRDRLCNCGLGEIDYHYRHTDSIKLCQNYK